MFECNATAHACVPPTPQLTSGPSWCHPAPHPAPAPAAQLKSAETPESEPGPEAPPLSLSICWEEAVEIICLHKT